MALVLGAIADDFTGATDLANTWVQQGVRVRQIIGVPGDASGIGDAEAVVVALKSRTCPPSQAVAQSLAALDWLRANGARQILFKYCSTFDSTARGNIGPVADALADALGVDFALVCPAFPDNGRTVFNGHLFVGDQLLSESPMKDHPLTPMRDSNLIRLMSAQSASRVGLVPWREVDQGAAAIGARIEALKADGVRFGVADALSNENLHAIGQAAADHLLVTGGSGVGMGLPANLRRAGVLSDGAPPRAPRVAGRELVLAGSCSAATRAQIGHVMTRWPTRKIDVDRLAEGPEEVRAVLDWALAQPANGPVLIYASADPDEVATIQARHGVERAGALVEDALSDLAVALSGQGFRRIVAAGGETSGAVVSGLGVQSLTIGPEIAPGVPWTESTDAPHLALALKSGNFGAVTFFEDAFAMLPLPG